MSLSARDATLLALQIRTLTCPAAGTSRAFIVRPFGRVSPASTLNTKTSPTLAPAMPKVTSEHVVAAMADRPITPVLTGPRLANDLESSPSSLSASAALPETLRKPVESMPSRKLESRPEPWPSTCEIFSSTCSGVSGEPAGPGSPWMPCWFHVSRSSPAVQTVPASTIRTAPACVTSGLRTQALMSVLLSAIASAPPPTARPSAAVAVTLAYVRRGRCKEAPGGSGGPGHDPPRRRREQQSHVGLICRDERNRGERARQPPKPSLERS